jgi:hypothetical protein
MEAIEFVGDDAISLASTGTPTMLILDRICEVDFSNPSLFCNLRQSFVHPSPWPLHL